MTLLGFIWATACAFIGLSVSAIGVVTARRLLSRRRSRLAVRVRQELVSCVVQGEAEQGVLSKAVRIAAHQGCLASVILQVCATVRGQARDVFLERLASNGAIAALGRSLRYGSRMERVRVAEALGVFSDRGAAVHLRAAWHDRAPRVRFAAYYASTEIGDGPTFDQALHIAVGASGKKQVAARGLLRRLSSSCPGEAVDWMARADLTPSLRCAMIEGLGTASPTAHVASVLVNEAGHHDLEVRSSAITALASCNATSGHSAVLAALADPTWPVRVRAIAAVSRLRLHRARPALERMLDDSDWWVRYRASEALAVLAGASSGAAV